MKPAFYESLDKIPEADRGDYKLVTEAGSPNFNKYVLDLDPQHPVALKNAELLGEKSTRDAAQTAAVNAAVAPKDAEILNLKAQVQAAQAQSALPAGHVAIPADSLTQLNNFKSLGEFDAVKAKVEEHGTLKERDEANTRKTLFGEVAKANNLNEEVFAKLAEPIKLQDKLESREIDDGKGNKVKHWFVKGKDDKGADTSVAVADFVKSDGNFSPFLNSLQISEDSKKVKIPNQKHGDPAKTKSGGASYIEKTYGKKAEAKTAE